MVMIPSGPIAQHLPTIRARPRRGEGGPWTPVANRLGNPVGPPWQLGFQRTTRRLVGDTGGGTARSLQTTFASSKGSVVRGSSSRNWTASVSVWAFFSGLWFGCVSLQLSRRPVFLSL